MKDFVYYAPTEVVFGKESEEQVARLVRKYGGTKVLVHYGGQSAVRSGLLDKICGLLNEGNIEYVTLGGVIPNPRLSLAQEGIELCRREGVDFILAVGGGSVIDSAKCIAYGVGFEGNVWDIYLGKAEPQSMLPVASVLTIPAAGSEMSEASVITNEDGDIKLGYSNNMSRPKFAIMNPCRTMTLPPYQTAAGVTDMMMHTMERYFTKDDDMNLTTDLAEAVLRRMKTAVFEVLKNPEDYRNRAQWCRTSRNLAQLGSIRNAPKPESLRSFRCKRYGCSQRLHRSRRHGTERYRGYGTFLPCHRHAHQHQGTHWQRHHR